MHTIAARNGWPLVPYSASAKNKRKGSRHRYCLGGPCLFCLLCAILNGKRRPASMPSRPHLFFPRFPLPSRRERGNTRTTVNRGQLFAHDRQPAGQWIGQWGVRSPFPYFRPTRRSRAFFFFTFPSPVALSLLPVPPLPTRAVRTVAHLRRRPQENDRAAGARGQEGRGHWATPISCYAGTGSTSVCQHASTKMDPRSAKPGRWRPGNAARYRNAWA